MDYLKAFLVGGLFCLVGQILIDKTKLTPARILVSYVVIGVFLGALGVYEPIVEFAGAGATVPLTGFGNNLAKGVKEAVQQDGFLGIFTGGLKASAGGITAAVIAGLLASLIFKPKDKAWKTGQSMVAAKTAKQISEEKIMNNNKQNNTQNTQNTQEKQNSNQQNTQNTQQNQNQNQNQNKNCR